MGRKIALHHTLMEKQLGWPDCFLPLPAGIQKNNLYYKSHWEPVRKNWKVHKIKAFIFFGWCRQKDRLFLLMEIEQKWAQPIHNWWSFIIKPYLGMGLFHFSIVINGRVLFSLFILSSDLIFAYLFEFI